MTLKVIEAKRLRDIDIVVEHRALFGMIRLKQKYRGYVVFSTNIPRRHWTLSISWHECYTRGSITVALDVVSDKLNERLCTAFQEYIGKNPL